MRLWNAHRPVQYYRGRHITPKYRSASPTPWSHQLSPDVVKFVRDLKRNNLAGTRLEQKERIHDILVDPAVFFSRPKNVPLQLRKQVYLPPFLVCLMRTPKSPPKYASFWVPLWFNKLDFKNYLKNGYNVDVLHVRSYVQQQKVRRKRFERNGQIVLGPLYRPLARKMMTVELVDPFVYPAEEKDLTPFEPEAFKQEFLEVSQGQNEDAGQPSSKTLKQVRHTMAQQAKELLEGKRKWKPTWQSIPANSRSLLSTTRPQGIRGVL